MKSQSSFRLKVRQVEQSCVFDLSSFNGREISATLKYPEKLTELHQNWQQIYRRRYQLHTRARVSSKSGSGTPIRYDWDQELRFAETALLTEFDYWLGQAELLEIRETIQQSMDSTLRTLVRKGKEAPHYVEVLLECSPISLARLPWETWKLAPKNVALGDFRIVRTVTTGVMPAPAARIHRSRARILVILGDAPDLNSDHDRQALRSLLPLVELEFIHCRLDPPGDLQHRSTALKHRIATAIADVRGWDGLVFAGHSDESPGTGGKLELAPDVSLAIWEIDAPLAIAIQRGLRLAIFNSCSGLQIAEALIRQGLSQVLVMREPIQDQVAQTFLKQLCQQLARCHDVSTALQTVYQYFLAEQISYPSAYLVPSLFCHPDPQAAVFQIEPSRLKRFWHQWQPTRREAIVFGILSFLSLTTPVRDLLLDTRYWVQAAYRQPTHQRILPQIPPVTVVAIDQASIERNNIDSYKINPIDRSYLAKLIGRLQQLNAKVIGIDYLLDGSTQEDLPLSKTIDSAIKNQHWIVLATEQNSTGQPLRVNKKSVNSAWILPGDTLIEDWNLMRPANPDCQSRCPFAYQLALAFTLHKESKHFLLGHHQSDNAISLQHQISTYLQQPENAATKLFQGFNFPAGLTPILDFSLPPDQVYQKIAAWDLLERPIDDPMLRNLSQQAVIIAAGGYDQADDNFSVPLAISFWRSYSAQPTATQPNVFSGGEAHAYAVHHWLSHHRVVRIPDLWLLAVAVVGAKATNRWRRSQSLKHRQRSLLLSSSIPLIYGLIGLQTYTAVGILVPWFLPSLLFWSYLRD